jgi:transketolase
MSNLLIENYLQEDILDRKATRDGLGDALVELGTDHEDIVVVNADLPSSLRLEDFAEKYPDRYVQVGVAEQVMAGVGTGLALSGKRPLITSFAAFSPGLNWSHIRLAAMSEANVIVASSHYGLNVGEDGASAQMLEDIALMRVLPHFTVLTPADYNQTRQALRAVVTHDGPVYIRFTRSKYPVFIKESAEFQLGKAQVMREGDKATVVAHGSLVYETLQAAESLASQGIELQVINLHTVKPIDWQAIADSLANTGKLITVEEHQQAGGMGSAVLEALASNLSKLNFASKMIAVEDRFGTSGPGEEIVKAYGLDRDAIAENIKAFVERS